MRINTIFYVWVLNCCFTNGSSIIATGTSLSVVSEPGESSETGFNGGNEVTDVIERCSKRNRRSVEHEI